MWPTATTSYSEEDRRLQRQRSLRQQIADLTIERQSITQRLERLKAQLEN